MDSTMKFLIIFSVMALTGNVLPVSAGSLVADHYGDLYHEGKLRMTTDGRFYRSHEEDLEDARRDAVDQAFIDTERALQQAAAQQYNAQEQAEAQAIANAEARAAFMAGQEAIARNHGASPD
jgi:hypothetical protein